MGLEGAPTGRSTRRRVSVQLWPMATPDCRPLPTSVCLQKVTERPHLVFRLRHCPDLPSSGRESMGTIIRGRCSMRPMTTHRIAVAGHMVGRDLEVAPRDSTWNAAIRTLLADRRTLTGSRSLVGDLL